MKNLQGAQRPFKWAGIVHFEKEKKNTHNIKKKKEKKDTEFQILDERQSDNYVLFSSCISLEKSNN